MDMLTRFPKQRFAATKFGPCVHARSASVWTARKAKELQEKTAAQLQEKTAAQSTSGRKADLSQPEKSPTPLDNFSASVSRLKPREKLYLAIGMLAFSSAGVYFTYYFERLYPADPERLTKFTDRDSAVKVGLPKSRLDVVFSGDQELRRKETAAILAEDEIEEAKARSSTYEGR
ncbi:hypothetical protein BJ742DRAFT_843621 [Cladochytrium replicatum]|nr:hypothetical protein BJ742DRAFT_843621 [Cladochytrium replicatum]